MGIWDRKKLLDVSDDIRARIELGTDNPDQLAELRELYIEVAKSSKNLRVNAIDVDRFKSRYATIVKSSVVNL